MFGCLSAGRAWADPPASVTQPVKLSATPLTDTDTDQPVWRAMHGLLLGVARADNRLIAVGNEGGVLLSDDGGASWRRVPTPNDELLTAVLFPTPKEGWAVGQDELILHSTDAGETWKQVHFAAATDQALFSVAAVAAPRMVATGAYDLVLDTQDGNAWQESKIPNLDDDFHLNCALARGDDILVTGEAGNAFVRHAGTWSPIKLPYNGSQFACQIGHDGSFYSFGLRGSAFRLQPGSTAWAKIDLGGPQSTFGSTTMADGHIALVGSNGVVRLLDTATGAVKTLPSVTDRTLSAVVESSPGHLVAVGEDGVHLIDIAAATAAAEDAP